MSPVLGTRQMAVGFADMCGYTKRSQTIDHAELEDLLCRFEQMATSVVASQDGWLVKHLGDGVLFASHSPKVATRIGLGLVDGAIEAGLLPLRAGISSGRVLVRRGDCFGTVVNRARRITDISPCGSVVVDASVRAAIGESFDLVGLGERTVRDFDRVPLWKLDPSPFFVR